MTVVNDSAGGAASPAGFTISAELSMVLTAQGPHGERALNLLRDAAAVLSDPARWNAPYEVAQSCCRGAIDSILNLAPKDIEGIEAARAAVTDAAKSAVEACRADGSVPQGLLDELAAAVDALRAEEANPGGRRIRQIGHLVQELTRQEMGLAEVEAVRNSWTRFYRDTSGVVHGSGATPEQSRERFEGVVAAFEQLFLGLPERAERLRQLALSEQPLREDAAEVASMSDPRAGSYFFRAAVSRRWLDLLPLERLLPETSRWPALPYLRRLLDADAPQMCGWVQQHLAAIEKRGPGAVGTTVSLVAGAGMTACALLQQIAREQQDRHVLLRISFWARDVPMSDRNGQWVSVVEEVLRTPSFGTEESWEAAQLARALTHTAHPGGQLRPARDRLGVIIRSALASVLAVPLAEADTWRISMVNDLREISFADPPRDVLFALMRAVLDLARQDARLGVPLSERWRVLDSKLPAGAAANRLRAVVLLESYDDDRADPVSSAAWWVRALPLASRLAAAGSARADVADFLALLEDACPDEHRADLHSVLAQGLGEAPSAPEISAWKNAYETASEPLPPAWRTVWDLSAVLAPQVLEPWGPMLEMLTGLTGRPAPARPVPRLQVTSWVERHGGLAADVFAARAAEDGPAAAAGQLVAAPVARSDVDAEGARAGLLGDLVSQDPQLWARDPDGVAEAAAGAPIVLAAYFNSLHRAAREERLSQNEVAAIALAAFAARPAAGQDGPGTEQLRRVICNLLHRAWESGLLLDMASGDAAGAVEWLQDLVTGWTRPRTDTPQPLWTALDQPGGTALISLIAWALQQAHRTGQALPDPTRGVLARLLADEPDDQALAVIGMCLGQLADVDAAWVEEHAEPLYALDAPWRPAATWLHQPRPHASVLACLDRTALLQAAAGPDSAPVLGKIILSFLDGSEVLGPAPALLAELAARDGGLQAVSELLSHLAQAVIRCDQASPWTERAAALWRSALEARLGPAALTGAGRFAYADHLDDAAWLELTALTVVRQPDLEAPYAIAERAARHPDSADALLIAAAMLGAQVDSFDRQEIQRHAARLFAQSTAQGTAEHEQLRLALINAGAIEAAYKDPPPGP
ncbi:hypothetical protein [Streptomyces sp. NBC_00878]|uniref:hypothetical protein n=1 Tax=Streptomyces sp. NBC_00878 TaxID=2975854 RepID=UPI002255BB67|nr:hypothetical protein [Streptomyces sp. NBC_00878]MCX4911929.1 hypothetical protein [Streptomyces sp. NBC_00878]